VRQSGNIITLSPSRRIFHVNTAKPRELKMFMHQFSSPLSPFSRVSTPTQPQKVDFFTQFSSQLHNFAHFLFSGSQLCLHFNLVWLQIFSRLVKKKEESTR
jgi:hypothetical protein